MADDEEILNPDGNCLGVALIDAWQLAGLARPAMRLATLRTPQEAVTALSTIQPPRLYSRPGARFLERMLHRRMAKRLGIALVQQADLPEHATFLCTRTIHQLYGLPYSNGHWVAIKDGKVYDQLQPKIRENFPDARQALPAKILSQFATTLVL